MKIRINTSILHIRADHSTTSASLGFATPGIYEVSNKYVGIGYIWYKIDQG